MFYLHFICILFYFIFSDSFALGVSLHKWLDYPGNKVVVIDSRKLSSNVRISYRPFSLPQIDYIYSYISSKSGDSDVLYFDK